MSANSFVDPELLRRIQALELQAREVAEGVLLGIHHAPDRGRSIEFAEHKEYSPGDDLRRIDWKVYAKSDRLYIKEYEDDTNITSLVLLDGSASMSYQGQRAREAGSPTKLDYARTIAAALSYLLLTQSDSVGLGIMGRGIHGFLPPRARQAHFHEIVARLAELDVEMGTDIGRALADAASLVKGRALIIIISDLLDDPGPMLKALSLLRHRRHEPVIFHVLDPDEIEFPFERLSLFKDMEGPARLLVEPRSIRDEYRRHFGRFLAGVKDECAGHGIDYRLALTTEPPALLLTSWLAYRAAASGSRNRR
ncbi:MAG TPA: DUF58 domain-containing protein [bacterium]|nr:DUF58 domain-containing protein [bacterium]